MGAVDFYTYDDYVQWKGDWEVIDGEAVAMSPSPMVTHQALASQIIFEFTKEINACDSCFILGEEDWKVNDSTILRPDVAVICDEPNEAYLTKAPELIVEIVSKSSVKKDEKIKFKIYEEEKVPYYILVYPAETKAKIYKLIEGSYSKEGDFFTQEYTFDALTCKATVSFESIFKKFRK